MSVSRTFPASNQQREGNMRRVSQAIAAISASVVLMASGAASAADLRVPVKAPPPVMPPPFSWTGFYVGGNLGGAWFHGDVTDSMFGLNFGNTNGNGVFIGGGQVGFNYQIDPFVLGVEGDFDWAANNNNATSGVIVPGIGLAHAFLVTGNNRWVSTVAARFGYAVDHVLFYGKAGGGWVGANSFTVTDLTSGVAVTGSSNTTISGWLVGGGLEWAFADNWSAKFEYDYLGLGGRTFTVPVGSPLLLVGDTFTTGNRNFQMAKVGLNYRFNWGSPSSVTTRY
jgi:outer membrane immunogenic protein